MQPYNKTIWVNDETYLNEVNMNKLEEQLELLTNNAIAEIDKGYVTDTELDNKNFATQTYVTTQINNAIGQALEGDY